MAKRYFRKMAIRAKMEATYGLNSAPTAGADAMQMNNVSFEPLAGSEEQRDLILATFGQQGVYLTGNYVRLEGDVELAGSGTAGTPPGYGPLLRSSGLAQDLTDPAKVVYRPVSAGFESSTVLFDMDGVRHVALGCRASVTFPFTTQRIPRARFTLTGLLGTISDQVMPVPVLTRFRKPLVVSAAATNITMFGWSAIGQSLELNLGNTVEPYLMIGAEEIQISDRKMTGTASVEATPLATINWFDKALSRERGLIHLQHGATAGNIIEIDCPAVEVGRPTQTNVQGILQYSLPLMPVPVLGDDEFALTIR